MSIESTKDYGLEVTCILLLLFFTPASFKSEKINNITTKSLGLLAFEKITFAESFCSK